MDFGMKLSETPRGDAGGGGLQKMDRMKTETLAVIALAAVLAFSGRGSGSGCGPVGCLLLPADFEKAADHAVSTLRKSESRQQPEHTSLKIAEPEGFRSALSF